MKSYIKIGVLGLAISIVINLAALFLFKKPSAAFFTDPWWSSWFPSYIVWLVFLAVGFSSRVGGGSPKDK
jgi:hypothetical protein